METNSSKKTSFSKTFFHFLILDIFKNVQFRFSKKTFGKNNIQKLKTKIIIGILSFSSNNIIHTYSTDNDNKIYINGKLK
jgi:hypothetical protein